MDHVPSLGSGLWKGKADFLKPFRTTTGGVSSENIVPLYDPEACHDTEEFKDVHELNVCLRSLVEIFPSVEPSVFREMLLNVSPASRVEIITEQMLKQRTEQACERHRKLRHHVVQAPGPKPVDTDRAPDALIGPEDRFRTDTYKHAVKQVLYQEFRNLSHSSIKAVMAEQNYSYAHCRPVLQHLSSKSWRLIISNLWSKRTPSQTGQQHPFIIAQRRDVLVPALQVKKTGSVELDRELYQLFVEPAFNQQRRDQLAADCDYAHRLNEVEAEEAQAMFECECCYNTVPFERLAVCNDDCHQLCSGCVSRSVSEALYGQGWARTIDLRRASVRCLAPTVDGCSGTLDPATVRRLLSGRAGNEDLWEELQVRLASEALLKSSLPLQRCPFCEYAEADDVPQLVMRHPLAIWSHVAVRSSTTTQIMLLSLTAAIIFLTIPLLLFGAFAWCIVLMVPTFAALIDASWARIYKKRRGLKFNCKHPSCGKVSCMRCRAAWRDPHICFEDERTSLRTAIESSATAAIKRTCPRCLLSFVKSSGCNKLVCNCGYTMCYICRSEITTNEGYAHFCQHFRPSGGRCTECDRCDLYGNEDEEAAIRRAAEIAEKEWREKEGRKAEGNDSAQLMVDLMVGQMHRASWWEAGLDAVVDAVAM